MAHQIDYEILGDDIQTVIHPRLATKWFGLKPGLMMFMTDGIQINMSTGVDC